MSLDGAVAMHEINAMGACAISLNGGKLRLGERTISDWARAAGGGITDFQAIQIRSGVETPLASGRISTATRGGLPN